MIIPWEKLNNLPVETESGQGIGRVYGLDVETESSLIKNYRVKSKGIIKGFLASELIISRDEVISISEEKMVVNDATITEKSAVAEKVKAIQPQAGAKISSQVQSTKNQ